MKLQSLSCPHCGAVLNITNSTKVAHCEFCDADIILEQLPPEKSAPPLQYNDAAMQKWKKKLLVWNIALFLSVFIFLLMIDQDSHSKTALIPFLMIIVILAFGPLTLSIQKPREPDISKNRPIWNGFKYFMLFIANIFISLVITVIISMILGIK